MRPLLDLLGFAALLFAGAALAVVYETGVFAVAGALLAVGWVAIRH